MYLRDSVSGVIRVVRTRPVLEGGLGTPVQRIVRVCGGLALSVEHRRQIAVVVVGVRLGIEQRIVLSAHVVQEIGEVGGSLRQVTTPTLSNLYLILSPSNQECHRHNHQP